MRNKRAIAALQECLKKFGDVLLSEAIDRLQNPRSGPRPKWDNFTLYEMFMCVEAIKARGVGTTAAWKAAAKFHKVTPRAVEKAHAEGRRRFGRALWEGYSSEVASKILSQHKDARPRLKKFLLNMKPASETRTIRR